MMAHQGRLPIELLARRHANKINHSALGRLADLRPQNEAIDILSASHLASVFFFLAARAPDSPQTSSCLRPDLRSPARDDRLGCSRGAPRRGRLIVVTRRRIRPASRTVGASGF